MAGSVQGGLELVDAGRVAGWCWSPDWPRERLVAEILLDGETVASIVAARFREDLAGAGIGDGRHAFDLRLPPGATEAAQVIEARDHASGAVFGRIDLRSGEAPRSPALGALSAELQRCTDTIGRRRVTTPPVTRIAAALGRLGDSLVVRTPSGAVQVATAGLARRFRPVTLLYQPTPALSIVLRADNEIDRTMRSLEMLGPCLQMLAAEVILVDDGHEPLTALIPSRVRNVALVCAPRHGAAFRDNLAVQTARAPLLLFLDDARPTAAALLNLRDARLTRGVVAGHSVLRCAGRFGATAALDAVPVTMPERTGVRLLAERQAIEELGGFDSAFDDGDVLATLDLCLKARLAGIAVGGLAEPPTGGIPQVPDVGHPPAEAAFEARWGLRTRMCVA